MRQLEDHIRDLQQLLDDFDTMLYEPLQVLASGISLGLLLFVLMSFLAVLSTVIFYYIPRYTQAIYQIISKSFISFVFRIINDESTQKIMWVFIKRQGDKIIIYKHKKVKSWKKGWKVKTDKTLLTINNYHEETG